VLVASPFNSNFIHGYRLQLILISYSPNAGCNFLLSGGGFALIPTPTHSTFEIFYDVFYLRVHYPRNTMAF
jgi:hypothetical protein